MVKPRHQLPLPTNHSPQSTWKVLYWFFYIEMALPIQSGPSPISFPTWWADCSLLRPLLSWALQAESRCLEPVKLETHLYPTPSTGGWGGDTLVSTLEIRRLGAPTHHQEPTWGTGLPKNGASRTEGRARRIYYVPGTADVVDIQPHVGFIINPRRINQSLQDSSLF